MGLSCVSGEQMRAFLAGELGEYDESVVVEHLDDCPNCERLAAELSDDREARKLARVNRRVAIATAPTPEVDDLCRRLHAPGHAVHGSRIGRLRCGGWRWRDHRSARWLDERICPRGRFSRTIAKKVVSRD